MTATVRRAFGLHEEPALRGLVVHWVEPGALLVSRRHLLYRLGGVGERPQPVGEAPAPRWRASVSRIRAAERLLRFSYNNAVPLGDGRVLFTFDTSVGVFERGWARPLSGLLRPTRIMVGGVAIDDVGDVYFGEYLGNQDRHAIQVYRLASGSDHLEVVHTFPVGAVRHVHGVHWDPFARQLWCVTGDRPSECRVLRTADGFRTLQTVGEGDESWRTASLVFTPRSIHYGTDAEFAQNHLYRIARATGERERLREIDGPVYYAQAAGEDLFFGVAAELCPSQSGKNGSLWHVRDGDRGECIDTRKKDALPVGLFQPGTWRFSRGPATADALFVHVFGMRGDNRTYRLQAF